VEDAVITGRRYRNGRGRCKALIEEAPRFHLRPRQKALDAAVADSGPIARAVNARSPIWPTSTDLRGGEGRARKPSTSSSQCRGRSPLALGKITAEHMAGNLEPM